MATCKRIYGKYVLTLTKEEAQAIADVTMYVGGHPTQTRRGLINNVRAALVEAGLASMYDSDEGSDLEGSVYFKPCRP